MGFHKKLFESGKIEEKEVDDKIIDEPIETNDDGPTQSRNFKYLDDLIHSGVKEIVLDSDIVLNDGEESEYNDGIKLDVDNLIIEGNGYEIDACDKTRIFYCTGKNIKIKNTILKRGFNLDCGAIWITESSTLEINNCTFKENTAQDDAGAIANFGKITINNSHFTENTAQEVGGAIANEGEITINNSHFTENTAQEVGGAIANGGEITINNSHFTENTAQEDGGAILNFGKITIADTDFTKNTAQKGSGSAINNQLGAILTCNNCKFTNNSTSWGDTIFNEGDNTKFIKCKFLQDKTSGEVVFNKNDLTIMDCIFKDNDVNSIILCDVDSILDLSGGEITDNTTKNSAVYNKKGNLTVSNTLFKNNTSTSGQYQGDILNEGNLTLQSPKFRTETYSVLNENHIDVKKLSHLEVEKIIKNTDNGSIDEFTIPDEYKYDFSHLHKLIQEDNSDVIVLNEDIVLENYESDFFEGGIEINKDNITIDGNNHVIDARNKTRIFQILGKNITIKNLILKNGFVSNKYGEHLTGGGAIQTMKNSQLTLEKCQFIDNYSDNDGGAIQNNGILTSKNNKYITNKSEYNGGAIQNNNMLCTINDTFQENKAKIAGTIYNNKKLTIKEEINLLNNKSDFKQAIYNTNTINIENKNINSEEIIYNTYNVNKTESDDWESFKYLLDKLKNTDEITLQNDIKIEYNDLTTDEIIISDLVLDGNNHIIDLNHLNLNFIIKSNVIFKNIIFKNAHIHKKSLFEIISNVKFENVIFLNNKITTDNNLIKNNEGNVEIIDSSFYNNSSKNNPLINNNSKLTITNTKFINNNSQSEGTIINNKRSNKEKVLIKKSIFTNNSSTKRGGTIISYEHTFFEVRDTQFINNQSKLDGGAIINLRGEFKLFNCIFRGNNGNGTGAISNMRNSILDIKDCNFNENTAQENGGAIFNFGKITLVDTDFTKNTTKESDGGAINNQRDGEISINNCNFNENTAQEEGGAILNFGKITLADTDFTKNTTKEVSGGAINNHDGEISINNCNFNENTAQKLGGAILNWGKITLADTDFTKNTTKESEGGAINNQDGEISINNCNFNENTAQGSGGAIYNWGGKLTITGSTLTENTAKGYGGAIENRSCELTITESTLQGNIAKVFGGAIHLNNKTEKYETKKCTFKDNKPDDVYEEK